MSNNQSIIAEISDEQKSMQNETIRYYEFGEFRLDIRRRELTKQEKISPLTSRNFDLLLAFVENQGRVMAHDELLEKVWEGTFVEQSNLKKGVSALRRILGESPDAAEFIKTVQGRGYCFIAPVRVLPDETIFVRETETEITVQEIIEEEDDEAETKPVLALPAPPPFRQRRKLAILASVLVLCFAAAAGIWILRSGKNSANDFRLENLRMQKLTASANIQEAALAPDGKMFVYATVGEDNQQTLWAKRAGSPNARQILPPANIEYRALAVTPDGSSVYYSAAVERSPDSLYQIPILGGAPRKISENLRSTPTFSPDGKRLAFARDRINVGRTLLTVNAANGDDEQEIITVADSHKLVEPRWSPDGKKFAFISGEVTEKGRLWTIAEMPASGGDSAQILPPQRGNIYSFTWLPDQSGLIMCADADDTLQTQVWRVAYPNGAKTRLTNDVLAYQGNVSVSADGSAILAVQNEKVGDLWSLDWSNPNNAVRLTETQNYTGNFTIFPDGRILTESTEDGQHSLSMLSADGGNPSPFFPQNNIELDPSVSPDGKTLLFYSRRSGNPEIWQADTDGRNAKQITNDNSFKSFPRLSPDGKYIYFVNFKNERWRLVKMPAGGNLEMVVDETVWAFDFSPDGSLIAYSFYDEQKKRWQAAVRDLATNTLQQRFDISPTNFVRWTRDGKNLLYNVSENVREGRNLWMQPADGSAPRLVFDAKEDKIFWTGWSPDGAKLYFTRGRTISNIVLLSQTKPD